MIWCNSVTAPQVGNPSPVNLRDNNEIPVEDVDDISIFCNHCGMFDPFESKSGDLCSFCGKPLGILIKK